MNGPTDADYQSLLRWRTALRKFLHWSEGEASAAGVTAAQHQLMIAVRGHPDPSGPTIGELADYLVTRHHSAVGLVDRAVAAGLVARTGGERPGTVRVQLTDDGRARLDRLSAATFEELARLAPMMQAFWQTFEEQPRSQ